MFATTDLNRTQVFKAFLGNSELSAPDIVKQTNLSRPTVDTFLNELIKDGLLKKSGTGQSTGGRKPGLFSFNGAGRFAIGVVVSIPGVTGVVVDLGGEIHASKQVSIPIWSTGEYFIEKLADLIGHLLGQVPDQSHFSGIGVAIPGLVDQEKGISVFFSRLSNFFNTPLREILEKKLKRPVTISRYLGSAAYSQIIPFRDTAAKPLVYVELSEGIEMALFYQGMPYRGNILNEGGLGHMVIEFNGRTCLCGAKGCLEAYACNRVLIDEAKLNVRNGVPSAIPSDRNVSDDEFYQFVKKGDALAVRVAEMGMEYLSLGIANVVNLLNPAKVIISGAVASAGEAFLDKIRKRVLHYALNILGKDLEIEFVPFRPEAGAKGVGLLKLYRELNILN